MIEAEAITDRELQGIAWAIRDMLLRAADDTAPSMAALGVLERVKHHAPAHVRAVIEAKGFAVFRQLEPERAQIWEAVRATTLTLARESLASLATPMAANKSRQRGQGGFLGIILP